MNLGKPTKLLILVLTILPIVYMAAFFASIGYAFNAAPKDDLFFKHFGIFFGLHIAVMLLMFGLLTFYIVFLFKTAAVKTELKALWAVVLFFGGPVAMPIFWYLYIWRAPGAAANSPLRRNLYRIRRDAANPTAYPPTDTLRITQPITLARFATHPPNPRVLGHLHGGPAACHDPICCRGDAYAAAAQCNLVMS